MTILVLNCGSSSIKYQVIDMNEVNNPQLLAKVLWKESVWQKVF